MAPRNLCNHVQAVSYFFRPSTRCSPNALAPFFWVVTHHIARNQTGNGVRVSWKIVPAVTEVWQPQPAHSNSSSRTGHEWDHRNEDTENRPAIAAGLSRLDRPPRY